MPDLNALNSFDWIILTILVWSIFNGVWKGFSHELFGLIGLVAAFFITIHGGQLLDGPMATMLPDNALGHMFGRAFVFLACIIIINILAAIAAAALRAVLSRAVDHSIGLIFGFARGAIIVLLPFLLVNLYIDPKVYPDWLVESRSYPFLNGGAHLMRGIIPESEIRDHERTDFSEMEKATKEQEVQLKGVDAHKKKNSKDEEKGGNEKWQDAIQALKETLFR